MRIENRSTTRRTRRWSVAAGISAAVVIAPLAAGCGTTTSESSQPAPPGPPTTTTAVPAAPAPAAPGVAPPAPGSAATTQPETPVIAPGEGPVVTTTIADDTPPGMGDDEGSGD